MTYRVIPSGAIQIQEGLFLHIYSKNINGTYHTFRYLYASSGYCFYDKKQEIYIENENNELVLVPSEEVKPNERTYYTYMSIPLIKDTNDFLSVVAQKEYEIV